MYRQSFFGLSLFVWLVFRVTICDAEFKDPLMTPAMPTQRLTSAPMTAVVRAGPSRLVAAGWRGVIAVSDDNGKSWKQASVPVREDLMGLAFPTPKHGWAVGNEGVLLESVDGGMTWTKRLDGNVAASMMVEKYQQLAQQDSMDPKVEVALRESNGYKAQAPARPFLDIAFEDEQTGYIVGTFNMLFRTTDGGKSWEPLFEKTENPNGYNIYCVRMAGNDVFLVGELGLALRLDRAKEEFVRMPIPYDGSLFSFVVKPGVMIASGLRGNAFRSADGGKTWQKIDFGASKHATFSGAATLEDGRIVMATLSGELLVSSDEGLHFANIRPKAPMKYSGVAPAGKDTVVVVGLQGIRVETIH